MIKRVASEIAVFAVFLALAIALTWPLALHLGTAVPDRGDPLLNAWIIDWVCHALTHSPLHLYDAPIYYPGRYPLAYSENMTGIALIVLPLHLAGLSALTVYNIALLLGFAFSAFGAFVLARLVTRNTAASFLAGVFFAFGSFKLAHIQHVQIIWSGWLPLMLAALLHYRREPGTRRAALVGAAFLMNGLTNIYWLMYGGFALLVTIVFLRLFSKRLFAALAVACLLLLPFLIPYAIVAKEYGAGRTTGESRGGSASFIDWLAPSSRSAVYGPLADPALHRDERELFPGIVVLFLAGYAVTRWRTGNRACPDSQDCLSSTAQPLLDAAIAIGLILTYLTTIRDRITIGHFSFSGSDVPAMLTLILLLVRFRPQWERSDRNVAVLWVVIGFLGSLGWNAFLHPFLFRLIMPFRATRTPARWAVIVYVGLAVLAALGYSALKTRWKPLLLALAIVEVIPTIKWDHLDPRVAPVYTWLARTKPGVVLELPILAPGVPYEYVLANSVHRQPIVNGTSGWETPLHETLRKKEEQLQYDDAFLGVADVVIVHESRLTGEQKTALAPLLSKLTPLRRFGSDEVFRAPRGPAGTASAPRESPRQ